MSTTDSTAQTSGRAGRARRDHWAVVGAVAGVVGALAAVGAWFWPRPGSDPANSPSTAAPPAATGSPAPRTATIGDPTVTHLDTITAETGGEHLVPVPRAVRDQAGFADHPIAIACPTNQTGDLERIVTWPLKGRYLDFQADVRPWYPAGTDQESATYVTALSGQRQPDGAITTSVSGRQQNATVAAAQPLTASVEGAEKLALKVECGDPNGIVVLTAVRLTPA
ncbi:MULTISPECIES: hypothetical protein [Actinoplanes]|uniref:hypothetical protein n=1 Tax=Actinoplanes TaxID=1865 RepID=UPI0005F2CE5E|nr:MULTISPECIES: hypothetical protein [Actinoplanes]GLY02077.1 hypothetical protein Acsp01_24560 [Actinoplanes sp. NBRC 101535]